MPENPLFPIRPQPSSLQNVFKAMGQSLPASAFQPSPLLKPAPLYKKRQYFLKQNIRLDMIHYEECRFDECVISVSTTEIKLTNCVFGPGNQLLLGEHLIPLVKLLTIFNQFPDHWKPSIQQAGTNLFTVTI